MVWKARRGLATVPTVAIAIVCALLVLSSGSLTPNLSGRTSQSSGLKTDGWYSNLQSAETHYCLTATGSNKTLTVTSSYHIVETNLTASSGSSCSGKPQHWGLALLDYDTSTLEYVYLVAYNNTTGLVPGVPTTFTYFESYIPIYGDAGADYASPTTFDYNVTSTTHDVTIFVMTCPNCAGGGTGSTQLSQFSNSVCTLGGTSPTVYIWDNVCFEKNYPIKYPHPDFTAYQMYPTTGGYIVGTNLYHIDFGSIFMSSLGSAGPIIIGAAIGAVIGGTFGNLPGAIAGAVIGTIITAAGVWYQGVTYYDEQSTMWVWLNTGFISAAQNVPWWVSFWGAVAIAGYLSLYISEVRVGNTWFLNNQGLSGP
jgi:hypothetical protein